MSWWWLAYPLLGCFSGFIAGLFGVGGGLTIVPLLFMIFTAEGLPLEHLMHLALGTSMATIMLTSVSSMRAHHRHGAVRWDIVRNMSIGLVIGTFGGSFIAGAIPTRPLAFVFTGIVYYAAIQMVLDFKPAPTRALPGNVAQGTAGGFIGVVSSLVAAGGGFLSIPYMIWHNVPIHKAVGTSSALGFPIAVAGTLGYIAVGYASSDLPAYSLGYIYLPAFLGVSAMTVLVAPLGAKVAHGLPVKQLKRAFGVFLAILATKMLHSLIG